MNYQLGILPSGRLHCFAGEAILASNAAMDGIAKLFFSGVGDGLFALAILKDDTALPPSARYWRQFSRQYLAERCHSFDAELPAAISPLQRARIDDFLLNAPPMTGGEYLSPQVLENIWQQLDNWICQEIQQNYSSTAEFLLKRAPQWHQVGRVCFHLAENKLDSDNPFAFVATYSPEVSSRGQHRHQSLRKALEEYGGSKNKSRLINLLSPINEAAKSSALLRALVASGDIYHPLAWTPAEAYQFLKDIPLFEQSGIIVKLPDWWKKRAKPRVGVTLRTKSVGQSSFNLSSMLDFKIQFALDEKELTSAEWQKLLTAEDGLMLLKGQWIEVDKEQLAAALAHWKNLEKQTARDGLSFIEGMRLLAGVPTDLIDDVPFEESKSWSFVRPDAALEKILQQIRHPETLRAAGPGKMLHANLRPYQTVGVNWLWQLTQLGLGACLADDMGLGKTIQIIALLLMLKKKGIKQPSLLVLPTSLLGNWQEEIKKFAPTLRVHFLHSSLTDKTELDPAVRAQNIQQCDVVITTYGMLLRQHWLLEQEWQLVVLDEAQAIKNPAARQTQAAKKLRARSRIALTGTPIENRLGDLWSLFDFICPGLLGSATHFKKFMKALEWRERDQYAPLRSLVQPYILRRMKTDKSIIADLPDKTELRAYCHLSAAQAVLYEKSVQELTVAIENVDGIRRRGLVLSYLLRFKQICNHPSQFLGDGEYAPAGSGKYARLAELCEEIRDRQEKVLVFTQFREMCEPLAEFLAHCFKRPGLVLHGGVPAKQRQQRVEQFQHEEGPPFFILSIKAGGTGLNLTAASHVIHFDRWWNPAIENQATDRAFRIGQRKNVLVHKFICRGTVEEKISLMLEQKSILASELFEGGTETLLTEMSDAELIDLVKLDIHSTPAWSPVDES